MLTWFAGFGKVLATKEKKAMSKFEVGDTVHVLENDLTHDFIGTVMSNEFIWKFMSNNESDKFILVRDPTNKIEWAIPQSMIEDLEDMSGLEIMELWKNKKQIRNLEMDNGIKALQKIAQDLGYGDKKYFPDDSYFEIFLQDNPALTEHIFEWIVEQMDKNAAWKKALINS